MGCLSVDSWMLTNIHRMVRVAPVEEEQEATNGDETCKQEKEKKNEEKDEEGKEKEKKNDEEGKEKEIELSEEQANGRGDDCEGEIFLVENLGYRGYRDDVLKDREGLDYEHAVLTLASLAKFHAASYC